jgi:hypothetical protein
LNRAVRVTSLSPVVASSSVSPGGVAYRIAMVSSS